MRGIVYVMAKTPETGRVKTRLCPPLSPVQAALLAGAFATDLLSSLRKMEDPEVRLALDGPAFPGPDYAKTHGAAVDLRLVAENLGIAVESQGTGDLGQRMARLLTRGLGCGLPTLIIGADAPDLPPRLVAGAFEALERSDAVLGPAADGGYVLVGARRPVTAMFEIDAAWSSSRVFSATCEALRRSGTTFETLAMWEDVDDAAALGRLAGRLDADGAAVAPATSRLLGLWRSEGARF